MAYQGGCYMAILIFNCDNCGQQVKMKRPKGKEHYFCSHKCYGEWRSKNIIGEKHHLYKEKIPYPCSYCEEIMFVYPNKIKSLENGKQSNIFCSKNCKERWESEHWVRENNPRGFSKVEKICEYCKEKYEVGKCRDEKTKFCSRDCKDKWQSEVQSKDEEWLKFRRAVGIKTVQNMKTKFTKPELMVKEYLENNGIEFIPQHPMLGKYVVDFYLPKINTVIEVLGDYWHGNPLFYGEERAKKPLTDKQLKTRAKDENRVHTFKNKNINILMIWEHDIYNCVKTQLSSII